MLRVRRKLYLILPGPHFVFDFSQSVPQTALVLLLASGYSTTQSREGSSTCCCRGAPSVHAWTTSLPQRRPQGRGYCKPII